MCVRHGESAIFVETPCVSGTAVGLSELSACRPVGAVGAVGAVEPESRSSIAAAVLSIAGYEWETFPSDAAEYGPMARKRRFWVGLRVA